MFTCQLIDYYDVYSTVVVLKHRPMVKEGIQLDSETLLKIKRVIHPIPESDVDFILEIEDIS
jgi:hypothetical protein